MCAEKPLLKNFPFSPIPGSVSHTQAPTSTIVTMTMPSHSSHATAVTTSNIPVGKCCAACRQRLKRNFSAPLTRSSYRQLVLIFFIVNFQSSTDFDLTYKFGILTVGGEKEDNSKSLRAQCKQF